ncbi:TetR/AcrR family transcriptional regulator [Arthrobacter sp. ISL-95]|uniref:TetR/AcrR family transcriptional regulator n=1 Tax=Arthrobacter sp. ISL-95 TaxID=2819116 RepID=UPI002570F681|nr:TetR/AcrR family transcriptional regulator [Arthrobacter sp. ISL-95]
MTAVPQRRPLSRERVLECAVALADQSGIAALTIRTLAQSMGTKPMSLYYYVANKDEILDGIVDMVFSEITLPTPGEIGAKKCSGGLTECGQR